MASERDRGDDRSPELALAATATATAGSAPPAGRAARLERGSSLGRYTVVDVLGEGGMGVVYGAYDPDLDRKVAIKLLRVGEGGSVSDAARARLLREARAMAKLSHPNVIRVYEVDTVDETDYLAMEHVDGPSLKEWLKEPRDWRQVIRVFIQAGRGLQAAHAAGLIHRDFKPGNVLLTRDNRVLVTDFGLARQQAAADPEAGDGDRKASPAGLALTRTGALVGTPAYMAPEQFRGDEADERTDQFNFCAALYEALYGQRPFGGDSIDDLQVSVLGGRVADEPRGSKVPSRLRRVVLRGLSVDPKDRWPSMAALLAELRRDPTRLRRRLAGGGLLALTGAAVIYLATSGGAGSAAAVCDGGERNWDGVWDREARAELAADFAAVGGDDQLARFAEELDGYKRRWGRAYRAACQAAKVDRRWSEEEHHLATGCLLERRDRVASLVGIFRDADAEAVDRAVAAAQSLPAIAACDDVAELKRGLAPPADPVTRERVRELRAELGAAESLQAAQQYARARDRAREVVERARELDYPPVLAEALYRLGRTHYFLDEPDLARSALEEALPIADEAGHDEIRARALVARFQVSVYFTSDAEASRALATRALAAVRRWGGDETLIARIENGLGQLAVEAARTEEAIEHFENALEIYERTREGLEVATARQRIGGVLLLEGEVDRALELKKSALEIKRRDLGDDHPDVARAHEQVAAVLRMAGDYDAAREHVIRARGFWDSQRGREILAHSRAAARSPRGARKVAGVVLDHGGAPVAGAEVVVGAVIIGDGRYLHASRGGHAEASEGLVRTVTDADGRFELPDALRGEVLIGAEQPAVGRSIVRRLPPEGDQLGVELRLRPYGEVTGRVETAADPHDLGVAALPADLGAGGYSASVAVGEDGRYRIRLPAGEHQLYAGIGEAFRASQLISKQVTVRAGETIEVDWELADTGVDIELVVRGEQGAPLDSAQVFLFDQKAEVANGAELNQLFAKVSAKGTSRMGFVRTVPGPDGELERRIELDHVSSGEKSLCIIPITGELKNPRFTRRLNAHVDTLEVHCRRVRIPPKPDRQRLVVEVPPMKPLPEPVRRD